MPGRLVSRNENSFDIHNSSVQGERSASALYQPIIVTFSGGIAHPMLAQCDVARPSKSGRADRGMATTLPVLSEKASERRGLKPTVQFGPPTVSANDHLALACIFLHIPSQGRPSFSSVSQTVYLGASSPMPRAPALVVPQRVDPTLQVLGSASAPVKNGALIGSPHMPSVLDVPVNKPPYVAGKLKKSIVEEISRKFDLEQLSNPNILCIGVPLVSEVTQNWQPSVKTRAVPPAAVLGSVPSQDNWVRAEPVAHISPMPSPAHSSPPKPAPPHSMIAGMDSSKAPQGIELPGLRACNALYKAFVILMPCAMRRHSHHAFCHPVYRCDATTRSRSIRVAVLRRTSIHDLAAKGVWLCFYNTRW